MVWTAHDRTYLVCRPLVDALRAHLNDQGVTGIPTDYTRFYDLFLEYGVALPHPADPSAAIWTIRVSCDNGAFDQRLTVLAFETRRVFKPTRLPHDLVGTIEVVLDVPSQAPEDVPLSSPASEPIDDVLDDSENTGYGSTQTADDIEPIPAASTTVTKPPVPSDSTLKTLSWEGEEDVAEQFLNWLRQGILDKQLDYNKPNALLHVIGKGNVAVVTPLAFQRFCGLSGLGEENFATLQKRFARRKWNLKTPDTGQNIWPLWAKGPTKLTKLNCWILRKDVIFGEAEPPASNKYLVEKR